MNATGDGAAGGGGTGSSRTRSGGGPGSSGGGSGTAGEREAAAPPYRLVATDLDGTLLDSRGTVSPRTRAALTAVTAAGARHVIVTGRAAPWARPVLDSIGYTGLAVCGQGSQLYDAGEHRLLTSLTLDRRLAAAAIAKIEAEVGPLALAADREGLDGEVVAGPGFVLVLAADAGLEMARADDRDELLRVPVNKLYIQHPELDDDALAAAARAVVGDLVGVIVAGEGVVELLPAGLSKAVGLRLAAQRLGVSARDALAFGDMPNDVPMLRWAAWGVAMANAHPDLREVADEVTASHDDDGVAAVLERVFGL